jgi:hypothetical protein
MIRFGDKMVRATKTDLGNGLSTHTVCKVTFGGTGDVEKEMTQIAFDIRKYNVNGWNLWNLNTPLIVLPEFIKERDSRLLETPFPRAVAQEYANESGYHVEIVGDAFNDFSFRMSTATYLRTKELEIPTLVLVKEERTARYPNYAKLFLTFVDAKDIATYTDQYQASKLFGDNFRAEYSKYLRESAYKSR